MDVKLTVLGNHGPYPGVGGACSGYLVEEGENRVLVDCGSGVFSRLQQYTGLENLKGIVISHLHSDHMSDLLVLRYAVDIMQNKKRMDAPLNLFVPSQPEDDFDRLNYKNAFNINKISKDTEIDIGGLTFSFRKMIHPVLTFAVKVKGKGGNIVYSADTSYSPELIDFASGCDLFLCEAALMNRDMGENPVHLTALQSGDIALRSGVKRLLLTHFWPGYNVEEVVAEAAAVFPSAEASVAMRTYDV